MAPAVGHTVHLVGGGPGAMLALRRHFKAALAPLQRPHPLVAYVGAASRDHRGFYGMIRGALAATTARMKLVKRAVLEECDLVFVSGGDVELGMTVLDDRDVAGTLRSLGRRGKPMFGISAGSLMLAREWVRFPDDDDGRAEIFPCLGIAPIHVDAHSEDDGWSELRALVRLLHARGDESPVGYGLTRKGGLRVDVRDGAAPEAVGTPIPRFVVKRGAVVEGPPLQVV